MIAIRRNTGLALLAVGAIGLAAAGAYNAVSREFPPQPETADVALVSAFADAPTTPAAPVPAGARFSVNIADLEPIIRDAGPAERADQVADWAMLAALIRQDEAPDRLRAFLSGTPAIRLAGYNRAIDYNYMPGRYFQASEQVAYFVYGEHEPRVRTLAQLADFARRAQGRAPETAQVFRYSVDLLRGELVIEREADLTGQALFSDAFGYRERTVRTTADLGDFLNDVQDIVRLEHRFGTVTIGGRRFDDAPLAGATLDDVAALYQAQTDIARRYKALDDELDRNVVAKFQQPYGDVVDAYNAWARTGNRFDTGKQTLLVNAARKLDLSVSSALPFLSPAPSIDDAREWIEAVEPRIRIAADKYQQAFARSAFESGRVPPSEPGFSLDPQWDGKGFIADLKALRDDPTTFVTTAMVNAPDSDGGPLAQVDVASRLDEALTAHEIYYNDADFDREAFDARLDLLVAKVGQSKGQTLTDAQLVAFFEEKDALARMPSDERSDAHDYLSVQLGLIEARNRVQCARYDGELQGTEVGMYLFYTDVLAKLWAGIDYYGAAPIDAVPGFLDIPNVSANLEGVYAEESARLPSTRLWFGVRNGAVQHDESGRIWFDPIATRVYSAGSNPLRPGQEADANEASLRVFDWWNRHFQDVADFEPAYHRQNQIMKWSILTGILAEKGLLADLEAVKVDRSHRFDEWYAAKDDLTFRHSVRLLPEEAWIGEPKTECMEVLRSYGFWSRDGSSSYMSGGVSLGSGRALGRANALNGKVPVSLRGLARADDALVGRDAIRTARKSVHRWSEEAGGIHRASVAPDGLTSLRTGGMVAKPKPLIHDVRPRPAAVEIDIRIGETQHTKIVVERLSETVVFKRLPQEGALADEAITAAGRVLDDNLLLPGSRMADAMSVQPEFAISRGATVIEGADGAVRIFQTSLAGRPRGPPTDKLYGYEIALRNAGRGADDATIGAQLGSTDVAVRVLNQLADYRINGAFYKMNQGGFDRATQAVRDAGFQRLQFRAEHGEVMSTGRVFTSRAPKDAEVIVIETGDARLPRIEGFVEPGLKGLIPPRLHLRRPPEAGDGAQKIFDDIATAFAEPGAARRAAQAIWDGQRTVRVQATTADAAPPAALRDAVNAAVEGRPEALVEELAKAMAEGSHSETGAQARQAAAAEIADAFAAGAPSARLVNLAKRPAIQEAPEVRYAAAAREFASKPDSTAAARDAIKAADDLKAAGAASGGGGGVRGGDRLRLAGGFPEPRPRRAGGERLEARAYGYRLQFVDRLNRELPKAGVDALTQRRIVQRLKDRRAHTDLFLPDTALTGDAAVAIAFRPMTGLNPETHASALLRKLQPDDIRLIVADDSNSLSRTDAFAGVDGKVFISVSIAATAAHVRTFALGPPGAGGPPGGDDGGGGGGDDGDPLDLQGAFDAINVLIGKDCDIDGDGRADREEADLCEQHAWRFDAEAGAFTRFGGAPQ